jgi:hypothetical protein
MTRSGSNAASHPIEAGDILIKHDAGGMVGRLIKFGQWFSRSKGDTKFVHAAIASSPLTVIEMSGDGLHENNLLSDNAAYSYDAFRSSSRRDRDRRRPSPPGPSDTRLSRRCRR